MNEDFEIEVSKKLKKETTRSQNAEYLKYLNVGFYLVTPLLFGILGGTYIDSKLQSKPIGVIIGIIIGAIGTFSNLFKLVS